MSGTEAVDKSLPPFRYLPNPEAALRDISRVVWPIQGDFVVFSIDPVASAAHLDKIARRAARRIPVHKFVALTTSVRALLLYTLHPLR